MGQDWIFMASNQECSFLWHLLQRQCLGRIEIGFEPATMSFPVSRMFSIRIAAVGTEHTHTHTHTHTHARTHAHTCVFSEANSDLNLALCHLRYEGLDSRFNLAFASDLGFEGTQSFHVSLRLPLPFFCFSFFCAVLRRRHKSWLCNSLFRLCSPGLCN